MTPNKIDLPAIEAEVIGGWARAVFVLQDRWLWSCQISPPFMDFTVDDDFIFRDELRPLSVHYLCYDNGISILVSSSCAYSIKT